MRMAIWMIATVAVRYAYKAGVIPAAETSGFAISLSFMFLACFLQDYLEIRRNWH